MSPAPRNEYLAALDADAAFSAALRAAGLDRWQSPKDAWPDAVRRAYASKVAADERLQTAFIQGRRFGVARGGA